MFVKKVQMGLTNKPNGIILMEVILSDNMCLFQLRGTSAVKALITDRGSQYGNKKRTFSAGSANRAGTYRESGLHIEKRKCLRYRARPGAYAALGQGLVVIGSIIDVDDAGLSMELVAELNGDNEVYTRMHIFVEDTPFRLVNIPCSIVSVMPVRKQTVTSVDVVTKKCVLQFGTLSEEQSRQMQQFIDVYTDTNVS